MTVNLRERIEAVLEFQDADFDLETVAPAISDARLIERIAEATHQNDRRSFVIEDKAIGWLLRSEAEDRFRKRLKFSDGRSLVDWQATTRGIVRELNAVDKLRGGRGLRALKPRVHPFDRLQNRASVEANLKGLEMASELRRKVEGKFKHAWRRSFQDGRLIYSVGSPLAANLLRPSERITKDELRGCMVLFSDDPSLCNILMKPPLRERKGFKDHIDQPYVFLMGELIEAGKVSAVMQAAKYAIAQHGEIEGEMLETTLSRLCKKYNRWETEGRFQNVHTSPENS